MIHKFVQKVVPEKGASNKSLFDYKSKFALKYN